METVGSRERPLENHLNIFYQENPFKDLTAEQREEAILGMCDNSKADFERGFANLVENLLPSLHPIHLLSHFAFYDQIFLPLMRMHRPEGGSADPTRPLEQAHLELLQALLLRIDPDKFPESSPPNFPQVVETIREETRGLYTTWSLSRLRDILVEPKRGMASEFFRMRTALVRNWGHTRQVFEWLKELFSIHNQELIAAHGISFTETIASVKALLDLVQARINLIKKKFQPIAAAKSKPQILRACAKQEVCTAEEIKEIQLRDWSLDEIRAFIIARLDIGLYQIFGFADEDLIGIPTEDKSAGFKEILARWALPQGALNSVPRDHLMMANPVSTAPIIKVGENTFFWPLIFVFQSFGLEMLMGLLSPKSQDRFVKRTKPRFCEDKVEWILRKAFPNARVFTNSIYVNGDKEFESDCFVLLDAFCFVIEVKSGRLRPSAHRGSIESLKQGLEEIVIEGSEQAIRALEALKAGVEFRCSKGEVIHIDRAAIVEWIPIVVTFEHLGEFSLDKSEAIGLGLLPEIVKNCLCVNIADLENVMEILPNSIQRLHYLSRRLSIENNFNFKGDEMDLLVFYLKTGFAIGEAEFSQKETLVLTGLSTEIDPYLLGVSANTPRPVRYLSPKWKSLLREIERRSPRKWTLACCRLLDQDKEAMDMVSEKLPELYKDVRAKKPPSEKRDILVLSGGPEQRKSTIIFIAGYGLPTSERRERAANACQQVSESEGEEIFMVFYMDLLEPLIPYHSLYFMGLSGE